MDYGQKPGVAPDFIIELKNGSMTYLHKSDEWLVCPAASDKTMTINANAHQTLREIRDSAERMIELSS